MIVTLFIFSLVAEKIFIILVLIAIAALVFFIISPKKKWTFNALVIGGGLFAVLWGADWFFSLNIDTYFIVLIALGLSSIWYLVLALIDKIPNALLILSILFGSIAFTYSVDFVFNHVLEEHQRQRINILLGREVDPQGVGYNVNQSKIAIGSGGLMGKGFLKGTQTRYNFVPEQSTDFIFCTVGEEWGFVGTSVVIGLFLFLLLRIVYLAERQRSTFSRTYGYGLAAVLFFHLIVNVGMTIGFMPVIGIPLPFFSYGGSSLWSFTIMLFIFIRMDASRFDLLM
jgi:rod shape determining protein RodA